MITYSKPEISIRAVNGTNQNTADFSFSGLSTDTKPTGSYDNLLIKNGSSFLEMDTSMVYFYDETNKAWILQ